MQFLNSTVCFQLNDFSFIVLQKTPRLLYFLFIQSQYILVVTKFSNKKGENKSIKMHRDFGPANLRHALHGRRSG